MRNIKAFLKRYPAQYRWLQDYWYRIRRIMETNVFGSRMQEWIWQTRHLYKGKGWAEAYLNSVNHPHRMQIVETIESYLPIESVLEIGCNAGANLILLNDKLPGVHFIGVDINKQAIRTGQENLKNTNIRNIDLFVAKADELNWIKNKSIDIVFTDAVLMFIGPDKIKKVLVDIHRIARKGFILNEYHAKVPPTENYLEGRWVYNYKDLINSCIPAAELDIIKSAFSGGEWDTYGALVIVRL